MKCKNTVTLLVVIFLDVLFHIDYILFVFFILTKCLLISAFCAFEQYFDQKDQEYE